MSHSPLVFERHITATQDSQSAIELLAEHCPEVSKQKLKLAMKYGAVWFSEASNSNKPHKLNPQRLRRAKRILPQGTLVYLYFNQKVLFEPIKPAQLIADRNSYSVWNKPSGMFSQGTKWGDHTSICRWIELFGLALHNLPPRETFLVHRLDRATNGLIVVAHSKAMTQKLAAMFESRNIIKQYSAIVEGRVSNDLIQRLDSPIDGREAVTNILSADYCDKKHQTILTLKIDTGRKHQIRKHLAAAGYPIRNDYLYGVNQPTTDRQTCEPQGQDAAVREELRLRSYRLEFVCPDSAEVVRFEIPTY